MPIPLTHILLTLYDFASFFFDNWLKLILLISVLIAQIYNTTAELVMPIRTPTNESNAEIEKHHLTAETKIRKCSK